MKHIMRLVWLGILLLSGVTVSLAQTTTTITGTVFRDYNNDAIQNGREPGIEGVIVSAFNDADPPVLVSTGTAINGTYSITITGAEARIEYTLPSSQVNVFEPGVAGGTSVQFVTLPGGTVSGVDMPFLVPTEFCQETARLATPCYANGDPLIAGSSQGQDPWLVSFPSGFGLGNNTPQRSDNTYLALGEEIGSTWGTAFHRTSATVFQSAFLKRHSGLGTEGLDGIYAVNIITGDVQPFLNVNNIGINVGATSRQAGDLATMPNEPSTDPRVWDEIARIGIGDIDVSPDNRYLWLVNATGNSIHRIFISEQLDFANPPTAADVNSFAIPSAGCRNGTQQAWTLEIYDADVFVGVTCTADGTAGTAADLEGVIMRLDTATNSWSQFTRFPLNYPRGDTIRLENNAAFNGSIPAEWNPWTPIGDDSFIQYPPGFNPADAPYPGLQNEAASYPQPVFSGLDFMEDGSISVGIMDRYGHQIGYYNYQPQGGPGIDETLYEGIVGGDILRLCLVGTSYQLENNSQCDSLGPNAGANTGQGPGGGEFYFDDDFSEPVSGIQVSHDEIFVGGMAHQPGTGELVSTVFDPILIRTGGAGWFNIDTGMRSDEYEIFGASNSNGPTDTPSTFGKANGLGDLEYMCAPVPLEIGNRIWFDEDGDGVQDAGEGAIDGVELVLWVDTDGDGVVDTELSRTTTDADGNYIFNSSNISLEIDGVTYYDVDNSNSLNNPEFELNGIMPGVAYEIRVDTTQTALANLFLTVSDTGGNTNNDNLIDLNDSDGILDGDIAVISIVTGPMGSNNHTLDFGFTDTPVTPTPPVVEPTVAPVASGAPANTASNDVVVTVDGIDFLITSLPRTGDEPWWRVWAMWLTVVGASGVTWLIAYHYLNRRPQHE